MQLDFDCQMEIVIAASPEAVQRAVVEDIGEWFVSPENSQGMQLRIEPVVGGRVYRDLGDDQGHLWGHISVLKPGLIEIVGPFASMTPSYNLVRFRFTESSPGNTKVEFTHQAVGAVSEELLEGAPEGWKMVLEQGLKAHVERNNN